MEYRSDLVYHCQDGPYYGIEEQKTREVLVGHYTPARSHDVLPIVRFENLPTLNGFALTTTPMRRLLKAVFVGLGETIVEVATTRASSSLL